MAHRSFWLASCTGALTLSTSVVAQEYPTKPVTIVVPTAVSSVSDILARTLAPRLTQRLGQPVVVENRLGAAGNIAAVHVAKATADGHTLLLTSNAIVISPLVQKSVGYDPVTDFAPIGRLGTTVLAFVVNPAVAATTVAEFVSLVKARPGQLNYATPGNGTPQHLAMEQFKQLMGVSITHVPFSQSGAAMTELVAGRVESAFVALTQALPQVKGEKLRILALAGDARSSLVPDRPSFRELGLDALDNPWVGMFAPASTPQAAINRASKELSALLAQQDLQETLLKTGIVVSVNSPADFAMQIKTESARLQKIISAAGIKAD